MFKGVRRACVCAVLAVCAAGAWADGPRPPQAPVLNPAGARAGGGELLKLGRVFEAAAPVGGAMVVRYDHEGLLEKIGSVGGVVIEGFPLTPTKRVDLEVERFWVTDPNVQFVTGTLFGDVRSGFDAGRVLLLRGRVRGMPSSHVYLGISEWVTNGWIDAGAQGLYGVSGRGPGSTTLPVGELSVFRARRGGNNPIPFCEVDGHSEPPGGGGGGDSTPMRGLRQLQLAVETDHEFFQLFGDENATNAYILEMYGAVSDIYIRNIKVRVDLSFVRVWPQANEPFTAGLNPFQNYWESFMQSTPRDVAQMFSGRGDLPGGVAYLSSVCNGGAYGFCGNALGYFADIDTASVLNYDPLVAAHELGHNCGTHHTDSYGLDNCNLVTATPQRGTIMSYCNQTVSGGMANIEMDFHKVTQQRMRDYTYGRACVVMDCNQNGISDSLDISGGVSQDTNSNSIPDECEDCNANGVLDPADISGGTSLDLNTNGVPDECEPDCNGNNVPDDRDIALGTSQDLHGDNIPDECDADRNNNNQSDYNEIMANMPLDKDRDRLIDTTQDCDNDGTPDLAELEGAFDIWAIAQIENRIREYHAVTGTLMTIGQAGSMNNGQDLIITPDRRILVSNAGANNVVEFNRSGQFVRVLVAASAGGLTYPTGMTLTEAGTLLVCSRGTNSVKEYNLQTGAYIRDFVAAGSGGLATPTAIVFNPGGLLYVAGNDNRVREYNGTTGAFIRLFVGASNGGLSGPRGMAWSPLGRLLVTSYSTDQTLEYNGTTGAFVRPLLITGLPVDGPWTVRIGPDDLVYVSRNIDHVDTHVTRAQIFIFDPRLGNFIRAHTQAMDADLHTPTGFDFMPGDATDCNRNLIPDSCDIAAGTSLDVNMNGVPDECEEACYANCDNSTTQPVLNVADFTCFLQRFAAGESYANCDGSTQAPVLNVADFTCYLQRFAVGCQ
jgi:DNA-binding beta-propeller fold protein YncE